MILAADSEAGILAAGQIATIILTLLVVGKTLEEEFLVTITTNRSAPLPRGVRVWHRPTSTPGWAHDLCYTFDSRAVTCF